MCRGAILPEDRESMGISGMVANITILRDAFPEYFDSMNRIKTEIQQIVHDHENDVRETLDQLIQTIDSKVANFGLRFMSTVNTIRHAGGMVQDIRHGLHTAMQNDIDNTERMFRRIVRMTSHT
jgi:hypothetical protein